MTNIEQAKASYLSHPGNKATAERLSRMEDSLLIREHQDMLKASFNDMFGNNAEQCRRYIAALLLERGITHIPNIFGAIEIKI